MGSAVSKKSSVATLHHSNPDLNATVPVNVLAQYQSKKDEGSGKGQGAAQQQNDSPSSSEDEDSNETDDKILKTVETSLIELSGIQAPWEVEGKRILTYLSKRYYKNKRNQRLFAIVDLFIKYKFLDVCVKIWDFCHTTDDENLSFEKSNAYYSMKFILWNYTDKCPNLAKAAYDQGTLIERCMREFTNPGMNVDSLTNNRKRFLIKGTLGMLLNVVRLYHPNYKLIRDGEGVKNLSVYYASKYLIIKAKVMMLLSYCINEEENDKIVTGTGVIAFIVRLLGSALHSPNHIAKTYLFSATETVLGLDKLAFNDSNKKSIVDAGILPLLTKMMDETGSTEEHQAATHCLWTLSFHPDNKENILQESHLLEAVHRIHDNPESDSETLRSCDGILFVVEGIETKRNENQRENTEKKHIMISYQWDVQERILQVRDLLQENGCTVWIDVDRISGSILAEMADGVENASVVIVAVTENYKNSNPCRTEAEYAYKLSKPIVPLLLQSDYKPDGWLGALIGMQLYINLSPPGGLDNQKRDMLIQLVKTKADSTAESNAAAKPSHKAILHQREEIDGPKYQLPPPSNPYSSGSKKVINCSKWSSEKVEDWAKTIGLDDVSFLKEFDGVALFQLNKLLQRSPDVYYNALRNDFKLSLLSILHLTDALERLA